MIQLAGKYATADIFLDQVDNNVISQTINILNHPMMKDASVKLMPDAHLGSGVPIGFTAKLADDCDMIAPDLVGVDISCGVLSYNLGKIDVDYPDLDDFVKTNIPAGFNVRSKVSKRIPTKTLEAIEKITVKMGTPERIERNFKSLGSLGGGNHYIELSKDENKNRHLTIHSGSRNFGLSICTFYNRKAEDKTVGIKTISGELRKEYLEDMKEAQVFASLNREIMIKDIIEDYFGLDSESLDFVHSIHNYYDFDDNTIRKGATPARKDEDLIIPFNMSFGSVLGIGKGNADWNNSAAHGAGRKMGRGAAKKRLHMNEFKKKMEGIYSSCVTKRFLDEAPDAYKKPNTILENLGETMDVVNFLKPVYNFKG